jgi:hypothetical protein
VRVENFLLPVDKYPEGTKTRMDRVANSDIPGGRW